MNRVVALALAVLFAGFLPLAARAADAPADPRPWESAQRLEKEVMDGIPSGGILSVRPRLAELEQALAGAKPAIALAMSGDGTHFFLADGQAEIIVGMGGVVGGKSDVLVQTVAVENPYPGIALLLGSYYNEVNQPEDALRVLDAGLAASALPDMNLGAHRAILLGERGAALTSLKRWPESLASYDDALKIDDLDPEMKAHLLRGRGFSLTELGRLDDAEQAYRDSLALEPGNQRAQSELQYIARLRAGAAPTATSLAPIQPQTMPSSKSTGKPGDAPPGQ